MTVDSARIFGCPTCGFRVSEADGSCPRCGLSFSSETKFECPFCGELVDQGSPECPSCHVNYREFKKKSEARGGDDAIDSLLLEIIQLEAHSARTETKKFSCPGCSWMVDSGADTCPRCGRDLASTEEALQCPICGSAVSADDASCPDCGSSFESAEESETAENSTGEAPQGVSGTTAAMETLARPGSEEPVHEEWGSLEAEQEAHEARGPAIEKPEEVLTPERTAPAPITEEPEETPPEQAVPERRKERVDEEQQPAVVRPKPPPVVKPIRAITKPVQKPSPKKVPEPEPVSAEPQRGEPPKPSADEPAGPPKPKQRKLKKRVTKQR